jgi:hypothetical protein
MKGLSRSLQERSLEVDKALENVNLVHSSLEDCRENVEQFNRKCYERSLKICEPLDIEIKKPRICPMVERKYVLRSRRVLVLLSHSLLVTGNTAEMRKIIATLLPAETMYSLGVRKINFGSL